MMAQPAVSRFEGHTLVGLGGSTVCAVTVGWLLASIHWIPTSVMGSLTAAAAYLPAAIDYYRQGRRRDRAEDIALMQKGELRRPVGLVVAMFVAGLAVAIVVVPNAVLEVVVKTSEPLDGWGGRGGTDVLGILFWIALLAIPPVALFVMSSYASHYLGAHPYRWTAVAVGCAFVLFVAISMWNYPKYAPQWQEGGVRPQQFVLPFFVASLISAVLCVIFLGTCWAGTRYGRRHHKQFVEKKLARLQRQAAKEAAKEAAKQDESTLRPPSLPHNLPAQDLFEEIEKLAHLRAIGALTEEEFQAKKSEILGRI